MKQTKTSFLACVQPNEEKKKKKKREQENTSIFVMFDFFLRIKICTVHIERFNVKEEKKSINLTGSIGCYLKNQ